MVMCIILPFRPKESCSTAKYWSNQHLEPTYNKRQDSIFTCGLKNRKYWRESRHFCATFSWPFDIWLLHAYAHHLNFMHTLMVRTCRDDERQACILKCRKVAKKLHRMWNWDDIKKRLVVASGRAVARSKQHRFKINICECDFSDLKIRDHEA